MSSYKNNFKVGQWVKFFATHDKQTPLRGLIRRIHPGADDLIDIRTKPENGNVSRLDTAHASDVTVIEEPKDNANKKEAQETNGGATPKGSTSSRTPKAKKSAA